MLLISTYLYIIYLRVQIRVNELINKLKTYFMPVSIHLNYLDEENLNWFKTNIYLGWKSWNKYQLISSFKIQIHFLYYVV